MTMGVEDAMLGLVSILLRPWENQWIGRCLELLPISRRDDDLKPQEAEECT
jgi:hypothetical protein